jgi:hypothetical protein
MEKGNFVHDTINRSVFRFHKKSNPIPAGIGDAGSCPRTGITDPTDSEAMS